MATRHIEGMAIYIPNERQCLLSFIHHCQVPTIRAKQKQLAMIGLFKMA